MITVPEPTHDPRFSTQAALNRTVVENWIDKRAMNVLDEWFAVGFPHKRLATEALGFAVRKGWVEGAQRVWDSGWVKKGPLLQEGWNNYRYYRHWEKAANTSVPAIQAWLIDKTWGPTDDKEWMRAQGAARVTALRQADKIKDEWDRYWKLGVDLSLAGGRDLLWTTVLFRFRPSEKDRAQQTPEQWAHLDRQLDHFLSLPDAQRAPLSEHVLTHLFQQSYERIYTQENVNHAPQAWATLLRVMEQSDPGMDKTEVAITLSKLAILGRDQEVPAERMEEILQRALAWGLLETVTFKPKDWEYGQRFYNLVKQDHRSGGYIIVPNKYGHTTTAAYTDPITEDNPVLHVGDHWYAPAVEQPRYGYAVQQDLTPVQKAQFRAQFEARIEAAELLAVPGKKKRATKQPA